jgi:hypothetical protein
MLDNLLLLLGRFLSLIAENEVAIPPARFLAIKMEQAG